MGSCDHLTKRKPALLTPALLTPLHPCAAAVTGSMSVPADGFPVDEFALSHPDGITCMSRDTRTTRHPYNHRRLPPSSLPPFYFIFFPLLSPALLPLLFSSLPSLLSAPSSSLFTPPSPSLLFHLPSYLYSLQAANSVQLTHRLQYLLSPSINSYDFFQSS